jgi:hypothetical protein
MNAGRRSLAFGLAMTLLCLATAAGCGGDGERGACKQRSPSVEVAGSCAFVVEYDGHRYFGNAAPVGPVEGRPLGTATQPGCQDTPDLPAPPDSEVEVAEIEGVRPDLAIMIRNRDDTVLIREDHGQLPPEVERLLRAPSCDSGEQSVELSGRWLGITGADGQTEVDLDPPYDVRIRVTESSFPAYERAELVVRVPEALGRPVTREDIESSLWVGGTLEATVSCRNVDFVASSIEAAAPR